LSYNKYIRAPYKLNNFDAEIQDALLSCRWSAINSSVITRRYVSISRAPVRRLDDIHPLAPPSLVSCNSGIAP